MIKAFYGWRIVAVCMLVVTISWSLGIFGMGVYIYGLSTFRGFSVTAVSAGVTLAYVMGALMLVRVGRRITTHGSRGVVVAGALAMASGVSLLPYCSQHWHVVVSFLVLGLGMACLSTNMVGSTLAPWFEKLQGRAMSTSMLGASVAGMISTPLFMGAIHRWGFQVAAHLASALTVLLVVPAALLVLKQRPQDLGLYPDGADCDLQAHQPARAAWRLRDAVHTRHFKTTVFAFGVGLLVQVGFLSHHVPIAIPVLGVKGATAVVFAAGLASLIGRLLLARYADHWDVRRVGTGVLLIAALSLLGLAWLPSAWVFVGLSISYGLTCGNVTTLSPIIMRREFGAASFGVVYGFAATIIQIAMALGPTMYGAIKDHLGSYTPVLLICGVLNLLAAASVYWGGRRVLTRTV